VAPAAARSTPGMFRSEVRSEEEDVFVRGCLRRRYLPAQSPGIKVADFLAVRPEHRGNDDGDARRTGAGPLASEPALIISRAASLGP